MFEIEYEDAVEHIDHSLTFREEDDGLSLFCQTCNETLSTVELPEWRLTFTIAATGWATIRAADEHAAVAKGEELYIPDDLDDIEYNVDDIEAELA